MDLIKESQTYYFRTLDALQAHRPFYNPLFKIYLRKYHLAWTMAVKKYWNSKRSEFVVSHPRLKKQREGKY